MRQCEVFLHGIKAGLLTEDDSREFTFAYDKAYLLGANCGAVSLTMPLRGEPYRSKFLFPVFANMLSEGDNREIQSRLLRVDGEDDFAILLATCRYDTIGAITVKPVL